MHRFIYLFRQRKSLLEPVFSFDQIPRAHGLKAHIPKDDTDQRKFSNALGNTQGAAQKSLSLVILCSSQMHIAQVTADNSDFTLAVVLFKGSQRTIPAISCFGRLTSTVSNQPEQGMCASKLDRVSGKDTPDAGRLTKTLRALPLFRKYSLKELQRLLCILAGLFIVTLTPADITLLETYRSPCRSFIDVGILQDLLAMLVTLQCLYIVPYVVPGKAYFTPEHGLDLSFLLSYSRRRQGTLLLTHLQGLLINMARFFVFPLQPGTLTQKL